jgi:hypothetical protein
VNDGMLSAETSWPSALSGRSSEPPLAYVIPRLAAVLTTLHRPTFCSRWA